MDEANRQARIAAAVELVACMMNGFVSLMWFTALALFLVGFMWLVPMALVAFEVCVALFVLVKGQTRLGLLGPTIGLFVSLCNLNIVAATLLVVAIRFQMNANQAADEAADMDLMAA